MSGTTFKFTPAHAKKIEQILAKYPKDRKRSGLLPILDLAQRQNNGWLSEDAIEEVARILELSAIRVYEVASFYSMFNLKPIGKYLIQLCRTTPCWLRGCEDILRTCANQLGIKPGETTPDGLFTLMEVECLGGCANAPVVQINDDYYEDLDASAFSEVLTLLKGGRTPSSGSVKGRQASKACLALSAYHADQEKK